MKLVFLLVSKNAFRHPVKHLMWHPTQKFSRTRFKGRTKITSGLQVFFSITVVKKECKSTQDKFKWCASPLFFFSKDAGELRFIILRREGKIPQKNTRETHSAQPDTHHHTQLSTHSLTHTPTKPQDSKETDSPVTGKDDLKTFFLIYGCRGY